MVLGGVALAVYSFLVCQLIMRVRCSALTSSLSSDRRLVVVATGLKQALLGIEDDRSFQILRSETGPLVRISRTFRVRRPCSRCGGLVANVWGPAWGGLFLAFPAIFCASATLIEKHEREEKEKKIQGKKARQKRRRARCSWRGPWQRGARCIRRDYVGPCQGYRAAGSLASRRLSRFPQRILSGLRDVTFGSCEDEIGGTEIPYPFVWEPRMIGLCGDYKGSLKE